MVSDASYFWSNKHCIRLKRIGRDKLKRNAKEIREISGIKVRAIVFAFFARNVVSKVF